MASSTFSTPQTIAFTRRKLITWPEQTRIDHLGGRADQKELTQAVFWRLTREPVIEMLGHKEPATYAQFLFPEWLITSVTPLLRTKEYGLESRIHEEIQGQETEDAQFCPPKPEPVSGRRCEVLFFGGCVPLEFLLHTTGIYTCCLNKL